MIQGQPYVYRNIAGTLKKMAGWLNHYNDARADRLKRKLLELAEDFETDVEVTMPKTKDQELTLLPFIPSTAEEAKSYYKPISQKKHNILKYCFLCSLMAAVGFVVGTLI